MATTKPKSVESMLRQIENLDKLIAYKRSQPVKDLRDEVPIKKMTPDGDLLRGARGMKRGGPVKRGYGKARGA